MSSLAEFMILSGADNRPPMLEKHLYDSCKSIMELYMQNREHERMILELVEHGPLIWPTIEENGVTRIKKYEELSTTEKIQADCDLKVTNIILQGLSSDVYSLVKHHRVAKDLWEIVQLLMQGTSLTKHEKECKLYDAFDLHTTNFDQLHAYLEQHELHANEVRILRERNQDPLALSPQYGSIHPTQHHSTTYLSTSHAITYPSTPHPNAYSSTVHQDACPQPQSIPQIKYTISIVNQQTHLSEFPQIDSGLAVPVFKQGDYPINAINKMMVTVQPVQERQSSFIVGTSRTRANISRIGRNNLGQQRIVKCFNCQGEGHMARQCPKTKRNMDATWFRGKVLNEEELDFLGDPGVAEAKAVLMANLSSYGSDVLSKLPHSEITHNDMLNQNQSKEKELLTKTFNVFKNESKEKEDKNIDKEIALEKKVKELDNIVCKMGQSAVIAKETNLTSIVDSEETLMLEEESRSKMLLKQSDPKVLEKKVNIKPINYAELNRLSEDFGKHFVPQQELSDEQAF
ncbi:ribonuclease H-like domain-containing protein [Tanacetum coccineum]|uniref:Ribonuclease H-like domain-containing protein n=1 Tax=Tanacetum coccineum TaxID=301880 RepID=A0ABQ4WNU0_9ASTR